MTQSSKGPLSGIVVVDLSRILAGPYCTLLMAEMGARVIKVEPPKGGDDARAYGPFVKGKSTYFASVNRGKESIALDLKNDEQRKIFEKLLEKADVIVENFRPGTMEKLGYGWDTLHKKYPKLIYASASGFGHTGPNSKDPAYDMVVQGMGGVMSITGNEGQPPARVGMSIGDIGAGLFTAVAVNAALVHRLKTGEATKVDIGMFDCQIALLENAVMRYTVEGEIPGPAGRAPSHHHALPGLPHRRRRHHHRRRQRRPLRQDLRGARPLRHGEQSRLQDQCAPPEASRQARARDRIGVEGSHHRPLARRCSPRRACRAGRSTTSSRRWSIPRSPRATCWSRFPTAAAAR